MDLFYAIKQMRKLSEAREPFSLTFMSYSRSRQETHGIVEVTKARLKPRAKAASYENAELIEEYVDLLTGDPKKFYQCTLMSFNGQNVVLS